MCCFNATLIGCIIRVSLSHEFKNSLGHCMCALRKDTAGFERDNHATDGSSQTILLDFKYLICYMILRLCSNFFITIKLPDQCILIPHH